MTVYYKGSTKFDNNLIFSQIIQSIILIFVAATFYDFIFEIFFLLQISTLSFIIRGFLITKPDKYDHKFNYFLNFVIFMINLLNVLFFICNQLTIHDSTQEQHKKYAELSYRIFHSLVVMLLTIVGIQILNFIEKKRQTLSLGKYLKDDQNKKSTTTVTVFSTTEVYDRKKEYQISILLWIIGLSSFVHLLYSISKNFILVDLFTYQEKKTIPKNIWGVVLFNISIFFSFFSIFAVYIIFYFIVRNEFIRYSKTK